jgi:hypothetical protein
MEGSLMESKLQREVRLLRAYTAILTLLCIVLLVSAFARGDNRKQRFGEIDAERVNIVETNGQVEMVISDKDHLPGPGNIVSGKFGERQGLKESGILFYNDSGDESGGILYGSQGNTAGSILTFDKHSGDQVLFLQSEEDGARRKVGFNVLDQPDVSPEEQNRNWDEAHSLQPGPQRDALMQQAVAHQRVFVGRSVDQSAVVALFDANGKPRIRMIVGPNGDPKIEFLDSAGKVLQALPHVREQTDK